MATEDSLPRKLDGAPPVLPPISTLIERRKLQPTSFTPVAEVLEKNGFSVGWNEGSLQVGGSLALGSPTLDSPQKSGFRPRTSGILSFSKAKDTHSRPRTSASSSLTAPPTPSAVAPPTPPSPGGGRRQRFPGISSSLDSAAAGRLLPGVNGPSTTATAHDHRPQLLTGGRSVSEGSGHLPAPSHAGSHPHTPTAPSLPSARPPPSPSRTSAAATYGGSTAAAVATPPALPSSAKVASTMGLHIPPANLRDAERPGTGMPPVPGLGHSSSTASGASGVIQVPLGVPHPLSQAVQTAAFKASRGHTLLVFNELDYHKNGKVTHSELEAAALSLGFSLEQAQRLWERLDKRRRGYLEASDWGQPDAFQQIQLFSTRYLQKYMGVPDVSSTPEQVRKYLRGQELKQVKSLAAAINMARANAMSRCMQTAGSTGNPIYDTFRFMDTDGSGVLSREELADAFFALGVQLSDPVVEQIIQIFDKDGNGKVQYHEFERTMFPPNR